MYGTTIPDIAGIMERRKGSANEDFKLVPDDETREIESYKKMLIKMKYLLIILIAVAGLFTQKLTAQSNDTVCPLFSKTQIEEKLQKLQDAVSPLSTVEQWRQENQISINYSDCYFCWAVPCFTKISYICPICREETIYRSDFEVIRKEEFIQHRMGFEPKFFNYDEDIIFTVHYAINRYRLKIKEIKGINISLDETEFCKYCSPYSPYTTNPTLYLLVNINGESDTTKTPNVKCKDIVLIRDFLKGSLVFGEMFECRPMADYIERIKELLGIKD